MSSSLVGLRRLLRGEISVLEAAVGDGLADAMDELLDGMLPLAALHVAVEVLAGYDLGGQLTQLTGTSMSSCSKTASPVSLEIFAARVSHSICSKGCVPGVEKNDSIVNPSAVFGLGGLLRSRLARS